MMTWANVRRVFGSLVLLLSVSTISSATTHPAVVSGAANVALQLLPASSSLTLGAGGSAEREASTVVRISTVSGAVSPVRPVQIFAVVSEEQVMRTNGRTSSLDAANLRVRNDRGEWARLQPMPQLNGRLGVLIATVRSAPATCLLDVQLDVPAGQRPGEYQGLLTVEAQER